MDRKTKEYAFAHSFSLVPRAGVEPARIAPLVFETSASTDSAIWAWINAFVIQIFWAEKGGFEPPVQLPVRQFSKLLV